MNSFAASSYISLCMLRCTHFKQNHSMQVLATDEFWPVQGGKPPDISQVKEVIDTILSSQKERSSSSK